MKLLMKFIMKLIKYLAAFLLMAGSAQAGIIITNLAATTITTTSAYFNAQIIGTNGSNPVVCLFYGTVDYTTNANSWGYSNYYGSAPVSSISTQITGLSALHKYYFRWRAHDNTQLVWTSSTSNFWTKPTSPTSGPPFAVSNYSVTVDTNANLKAPTNFFLQNKQFIINAGFATGTPVYVETSLTNGTLTEANSNSFGVTGRMIDLTIRTNYETAGAASTVQSNLVASSNALNTAITTETARAISSENAVSNFAINVSNILHTVITTETARAISSENAVSNFTVNISNALHIIDTNLNQRLTDVEGYGGGASNWSQYAATQNVDMAGNIISNGDFIGTWQGHSTNDFAPAGDYATGTPLYVESDPIASSNLTIHINDVTPHVSAGDRTNWDGKATLGDVAGQGYLTNEPLWAGASNAVVYTNTPTYTDTVAKAAAALPTNDAGYQNILTNTFPLSSGLNVSNRVVVLETNLLAFHGGTNINIRADGTNIYWDYTGEETGGASQGIYPAFKLDVGLVNGNWTDFEIKASTDNYVNVLYYYRSWTTNTSINPDTNAFVYFTDDYVTDVRQWFKKTNDVSISSHLISTNSVVDTVYFYPSHSCTWSNWMQATNIHLIWSWVRHDSIGPEMNVTGTEQRWNATRPDSWEAERTIP